MASSKSRSSPKKKRSKRKAVDSDGDANSAKKMRAGAEIQQPEFVDHTLAATRRSGRAGAGTGGRAAQLEKIGALLDASHTRSAQRKGTTSLDLNTPANPLAPEQPRKGRGRHSKVNMIIAIDNHTERYSETPSASSIQSSGDDESCKF
jgi:hypothetical protein